MRGFTLLLTTLMLSVAVPGAAHAQDQSGGSEPSGGASTGGTAYGHDPSAPPRVYAPGSKAVLMDNGFAAAPAAAPEPVQEAVFAANQIVGKPYRYGGGHARFKDTGYDCSGTISYALHGGGLLRRPLDSSSFMRWGERGPGRWITVYTNPGHAYVVIAGLRLDTSAAGERVNSGKGPRWRTGQRKMRGFKLRHPAGL
ncbi:MAG TPA: hypothetical protein VM266_07555 [Solirubrobacteraceae bacterium]|nr:hypothetical protein [Solirubrobacteraceae bacterium]